MKVVRGSCVVVVEYTEHEKHEIADLFSVLNKEYAIVAKKMRRFSNIPKYFRYFYMGNGKIFLPSGALHVLQEKFRNIEVLDATTFQKIDLKLVEKIIPREWQKPAANASAKNPNGIFLVPTAGGKTFFGMILTASYSSRTLILCDTGDIYDQWVDSVEKLFGIECGQIRAKKFDVRDITVATVQTLIKRKHLCKEIKNFFSLMLVDECQMIGPTKKEDKFGDGTAVYNSMGSVVQWFSCRRKYGLTDAAARSDSQDRSINFALGPVIYQVPFTALEEEGSVIRPKLIVIPTQFTLSPGLSDPKDQKEKYNKCLQELLNSQYRNRLILEVMCRFKGQKNLILANNKEFILLLHKMLIERMPEVADRSVVVTADTKITKKAERVDAIERARRGEIEYFFATSLGDKGLDVPPMENLLNVFPSKFKGKQRQRVGRVVRSCEGKEHSFVVDFADILVPMFRTQFTGRVNQVYRDRCEINYDNPTIRGLKIFRKVEKK